MKGRKMISRKHWTNSTCMNNRENKRVARFMVMQGKPQEGKSFENFVKEIRFILVDSEYAETDDILTDAII